jgi:hypothetical protein
MMGSHVPGTAGILHWSETWRSKSKKLSLSSAAGKWKLAPGYLVAQFTCVLQQAHFPSPYL